MRFPAREEAALHRGLKKHEETSAAPKRGDLVAATTRLAATLRELFG
jgi:hypothetical protein